MTMRRKVVMSNIYNIIKIKVAIQPSSELKMYGQLNIILILKKNAQVKDLPIYKYCIITV